MSEIDQITEKETERYVESEGEQFNQWPPFVDERDHVDTRNEEIVGQYKVALLFDGTVQCDEREHN